VRNLDLLIERSTYDLKINSKSTRNRNVVCAVIAVAFLPTNEAKVFYDNCELVRRVSFLKRENRLPLSTGFLFDRDLSGSS
jgi:hypothetical protein